MKIPKSIHHLLLPTYRPGHESRRLSTFHHPMQWHPITQLTDMQTHDRTYIGTALSVHGGAQSTYLPSLFQARAQTSRHKETSRPRPRLRPLPRAIILPVSIRAAEPWAPPTPSSPSPSSIAGLQVREGEKGQELLSKYCIQE